MVNINPKTAGRSDKVHDPPRFRGFPLPMGDHRKDPLREPAERDQKGQLPKDLPGTMEGSSDETLRKRNLPRVSNRYLASF